MQLKIFSRVTAGSLTSIVRTEAEWLPQLNGSSCITKFTSETEKQEHNHRKTNQIGRKARVRERLESMHRGHEKDGEENNVESRKKTAITSAAIFISGIFN